MMLISAISNILNPSILWINAAWTNIVALDIFNEAPITTNKIYAIPKLTIA